MLSFPGKNLRTIPQRSIPSASLLCYNGTDRVHHKHRLGTEQQCENLALAEVVS
ncbi:UNVERIFIED_CONTAM: hypothetical protein FKN15_060391 [Acipenser sinensis]